ncbi:MAG: hypothetical protein HQL38_15790 [Alphaproteobacteria bacterium]|nr:hypothetical protein [Alphaproteobacteria bacterium]
MNESIHDRLLRQAQERRILLLEAAIQKGPGPFVRMNFDLVEALHRELHSWDAVAELLGDEGLRWKNGHRPSGKQIRSLASRARTAMHQGAPRSPSSPPSQRPREAPRPVPENPSGPSRSELWAALARAPRIEELTTHSTTGLAALLNEGDDE